MQQDDSGERAKEYLAELDRIEGQVMKVSVPLSYSKELYDLRLHIEMLRNELQKVNGTNTLLERKERAQP
jgi:hypothetical protein